MKTRYICFIYCAIFSMSLVVGCSGSSAKEPSYPNGLIQLPNATQIRFEKKKEYDFLQYVIREAYPASNTLREISTELKRMGWKTLENDFLNPGEPSSHITGWTQFVDGTQGPETTVHQWLAQWKDQYGNVVSYALRYREPDLSQVTVWALFYASSVAESMSKEAESIHKSDSFQKHSEVQVKSEKSESGLTESGDFNLLLRAAAENGRIDLVKILLDKGINPNAADEFKFTALMAAARNGHFEITKLLLEKGADANMKGDNGITALMIASQHGYKEIVQQLIDKGTDLNAKCNDKTARILAKENGHLEIVSLLDKAGAEK